HVFAKNSDNLGIIYGDTRMLSAGGSQGVKYSAKTAQLSREAIYHILSGEPDEAASIDQIMNRFPSYIKLSFGNDSGGVVPIEEWNQELKAFCEEELFEQGIKDEGTKWAVVNLKKKLTSGKVLTPVSELLGRAATDEDLDDEELQNHLKDEDSEFDDHG